MNIHQYLDFVKDKPEVITKQDLNEFQINLLNQISLKLKEQKEYKITRGKCKVMLRPKKQALIVNVLPSGVEVVVLQTYHKWAFISYSDFESNLPQTGWVFKKLLATPPKQKPLSPPLK